MSRLAGHGFDLRALLASTERRSRIVSGPVVNLHGGDADDASTPAYNEIMTTPSDHDGAALGAFIGAIGSIAVAGLLAGVRDTVGQTNVALGLVLVVVAAAAVGGRTAGALTSVFAALSFNFFHTAPYNTLRMNDQRDIVRVALLFGVGLAVGELSWISDRLRRRVHSAEDQARRIERVATLVAKGVDVDELWPVARDTVAEVLGGAQCVFEPVSDALRPMRPSLANDIAERGDHVLRFRDGGFELPTGGVEVPVSYQGRTLGHIIVIPTSAHGVSGDERRHAVAVAAMLGAGLAGHALTAMV
jgi:Domain of unknown function (DUF4118)